MTVDTRITTGRPPIVHLPAGFGHEAAAEWAGDHRGPLRAVVADHGAVLVRGLRLSRPEQVADMAKRLTGEPMIEREPFARRTSYQPGVYGSSEWESDRPMCMHHESSHATVFPGVMLFGCLVAPSHGGATGLADSQAVLKVLPGELVDRFEREGWTLTRNYNDFVGVPWAEAFGTDRRDAVDEYCRDHAIDNSWGPENSLRTRQHRKAVVPHPVTGERTWFNQIAFLSEWSLDPEVREYLLMEFGSDSLPFTSSYGDGDAVTDGAVRAINDGYDAITLREPWQDGDLLMIDNSRMAHSRETFDSPRQVIVVMAEPTLGTRLEDSTC
jgi:alpha-ketoglutarate-dependent taurine dioxygenase